MDTITTMIAIPLGYIMEFCYNILKNYGLSIIAFTFISKIILLPLTIWLHKNSIKMVKMQPQINMIRVNYFGDKDQIAEEQTKLYKKEKYNPLASVFPLVIQIIILMGLIQVIYHPFAYLFQLPEGVVKVLIQLTGSLEHIDANSSSVQLAVVNAIQSPMYTERFLQLQNSVSNYNIAEIVDQILGLNMNFLGFNLSWIPIEIKGISFLVPIIAGFSAWLLCIAQNKSNVLQSEQGKVNKYGTMAVSVGISLYLGLLVPAGVAVYWIFSNLFAIVQMHILNAAISPKKYIDYESLEESRKQLTALENLGEKKKIFRSNPYAKREKEDYKRFFSIVNKHIVFYSEKSGFYKYFQDVMEELMRISNVSVHYITSDPNDAIFELAKTKTQIKPYYIGEKKLIMLMMKMDADIVIMTMPDLGNFHIKKSLVKMDIEYVYIYHGITNSHMVGRKGCLDNYNTIMCVGPHQVKEIRETEKRCSLPAKKLIECGYPLIEKESAIYQTTIKDAKKGKKTVTIAPSWQQDNILDLCLDKVIPEILSEDYKTIIRPHPEYCKRYPQKIEQIKNVYEQYYGDKLELQLDFSSSILSTDLLITDWSTIGYEYSFITGKATLFIDTPMKILNPEYVEYEFPPVDITWRNEVGKSVSLKNLGELKGYIREMLLEDDIFNERLVKMKQNVLFNYGSSSKIAAQYLIKTLANNKRKA